MKFSVNFLYACCLGLLFFIIEGLSVYLLTDFLHSLFSVLPNFFENALEAFIVAAAALAGCTPFFFFIKNKILIPYAFAADAGLSIFCIVAAMFSGDAKLPIVHFLLSTVGIFSLLGNLYAWPLYFFIMRNRNHDV